MSTADDACSKCGHALTSDDGCSECPNPVSVAQAWQTWVTSPGQEFKANHDRASFMAGYRRALEDAADAAEGAGLQPAGPWLRRRAASVGTKDGDDQPMTVAYWPEEFDDE